MLFIAATCTNDKKRPSRYIAFMNVLATNGIQKLFSDDNFLRKIYLLDLCNDMNKRQSPHPRSPPGKDSLYNSRQCVLSYY